MSRAAERTQASDDDPRIVEGRRRPFSQVAGEPTSRVALAAFAVVTRPQRCQPQRLGEAQMAAVARLKLGEHEAFRLECPAELRSCVSVLAQLVAPSRGRRAPLRTVTGCKLLILRDGRLADRLA